MEAQPESSTVLEFKGLGYVYSWVSDKGGWHNKVNPEELKDELWL
jgi:hypothetical protein